MAVMGLKLPPLSTLRLFDAAGRRLSFKSAAEELHITPSAVSHGIRALEAWLGVVLFARGRRGLTLTKEGREYLPYVREGLATLEAGAGRIGNDHSQKAITISVAPAFAARWLLPRLPKFQKERPGISIKIDTCHRHVEFPADGYDLAIRMGTGDWPGLSRHLLIALQLVPVCTPGFLERARSRSLSRLPLIRVSSVSEDWDTWLAAAGHDRGKAVGDLQFDTVELALQAASRGMGIAIGRKPLIEDELRTGRLVPYCSPMVLAKTAYWLLAMKEALQRRETQAFQTWLMDEAKSQQAAELPEAIRSIDRPAAYGALGGGLN
jgi:DNA-binding transcriptional LysR family regulator